MFHHITVLMQETIAGLNIQSAGTYVDCTLGGAGHSEQIAAKLSSAGRLIAIDQDEIALDYAKKRLQGVAPNVTFVKSNFRYLKQILSTMRLPKPEQQPLQVNGILFDLGVSSPQLDEAERGFSYQQESLLDMRMDRTQTLRAYEIVNGWSEQEIAHILWNYGEERFARRIAFQIVKERNKMPITTTKHLAELIKSAIPAATRRTGGHPAKRSFQALRIAVNDELSAFEDALEQAITCLEPKGRIVVITFHSLEDRITKRKFKQELRTCTCPPDFPLCRCEKKGRLQLISHKPIRPSQEELEKNPRSRSAKLRIAEKIS